MIYSRLGIDVWCMLGMDVWCMLIGEAPLIRLLELFLFRSEADYVLGFIELGSFPYPKMHIQPEPNMEVVVAI